MITDKSKPFSYRSDVVSALAEEIASSDQQVVVVHGGGSFGHTVAKQYGLSSSAVTGPIGVPQTRDSMFELNRLVCKTLAEFKVSTYTFAPFDLLTKVSKPAAAAWLRNLLRAGLTPLTFGDVAAVQKGFKVISGDTIVHELVRILRPDRCVFAMDVDGVYEENTRVIIPELSPAKARKIRLPKAEDTTGGMRLKLDVAASVAAMGTRSCFVSGYRRNEFSKALKGLEFYGTLVKS